MRYLSGLSPEHQQFWSTYISQKNCVVNGDYARASIYGHWSEYFSAYLAFLTEQEEINKLSVFINKPNLFRKTFVNKRPDGFIPMLRPTRKNFNEFILLLDKMLSENINHDFFKGDISLERHVKHENGLVEIQRINTLNLLENWLRENYRTADGEDVSKEVVGVLKQVRKLRQEPAHRLQEDEFDYSYPKNQDEILGKVCRALTKLRYVLWSHPLARDRYTPPEWLDGDMIVFY